MPFLNKVSGGSARRFGFSRRVAFYTCNTNTSLVTLNNADKKCYYPSNYAATATTTQQGPGCYSGGVQCGNSCVSCTGQAAGCGVQCNGWCAGDCNSCTGINFGGGNCGNQGWQSSYGAYYINVTTYSCPTNSSVVSLSGTTCVYPAAYNATLNP